MMYLLLVVAAILFASQFLFNRMYRKSRGEGLDSALLFMVYTTAAVFVIMLALNGFRLQFSAFSLLITCFVTVASISFQHFSLKAFGSAELSVFSMFSMLGGMALPFLYGAITGEPIGIFQILCFALITASLGMTVEEGAKRKGLVNYLAVFFFNGMTGVLAAIHQSRPDLCVDSVSYMAMQAAMAGITCTIWYVLRNHRAPVVTRNELGIAVAYAACCGLANLFCLIALKTLPASVQYPFITGGVVVFSAIISRITGEHFDRKKLLSLGMAVAATVLIIL